MLLIFALLVVFYQTNVGESQFLSAECTKASDCGKNECCVIGMQRFSMPSCRAVGDYGDPCRPTPNIHVNTTIYYPNGLGLELKGVYVLLCPCDQTKGLGCHQGQCAPNFANVANVARDAVATSEEFDGDDEERDNLSDDEHENEINYFKK